MWVSIAARTMRALSAHPPQRITGLPATPSSKKSDNTRTYCLNRRAEPCSGPLERAAFGGVTPKQGHTRGWGGWGWRRPSVLTS